MSGRIWNYLKCLALLIVLLPLLIWHHAIATIPVPVNIDMAPGRLYWDHHQRYLDLKTGEIRRTETDAVLSSGDKRIAIDQLLAERKLAVTVEAADGHTLLSRQVVDMSGMPTLLSGRYLLDERRDGIWAFDLEANDAQVLHIKIPPIQNSGGTYFSLLPLHGTNRFLRDNSASGQYDITLYAIEPDQLRILKTWPGSTSIGYCNDRIYNCRLSARQVEVRSAMDGELIETVDFPDVSQWSTAIAHAAVWKDMLVLLDRDLVHTLVFDLDKKKMLSFPSDDCSLQFNQDSSYLVLRNLYLGAVDQLVIYDRTTDQVLRESKLPLSACTTKFCGADQLLVSNRAHGFSAVLLDMSTGQTIGRWSPYAAISWSTLFFGPALLAWIVAWCGIAKRAHPWGWFDVVLIGGVLALMASYRTDGSILERSLCYAMFLLITLSVVQCLTWWLVMSGAKLVTSVSILLLTLGLAQLVWLSTIREGDDHNRWSLLVPSFISIGYVATLAAINRKLGRKLEGGQVTHSPVSVRDYLSLTVAMAVFFNSLRQTKAGLGSLAGDSDLVIFLLVPTLFSLMGLLIGFGTNDRIYRATWVVAAAAIFLVVSYRVFELLAGESILLTLERQCYPGKLVTDGLRDIDLYRPHRLWEAMTIGLVGPFLCALPLRDRGWREVSGSDGGT